MTFTLKFSHFPHIFRKPHFLINLNNIYNKNIPSIIYSNYLYKLKLVLGEKRAYCGNFSGKFLAGIAENMPCSRMSEKMFSTISTIMISCNLMISSSFCWLLSQTKGLHGPDLPGLGPQGCNLVSARPDPKQRWKSS